MTHFKTVKEIEMEGVKPIVMHKTGCTMFDHICGGIVAGGITILSAASGQGKSIVSLHLASSLSQRQPVYYISCENLTSIDFDRLSKISYINKDNFNYVNANDLTDDVRVSELVKEVVEVVGESNATLVLDGIEVIMDVSKDGMDSYKNGNLIMKTIIDLISNTNISCIVTWQLNRMAYNKKLCDITSGDIADSIGIIRYATNVWFIKREQNVWLMKADKSRIGYVEYDFDKHIFPITNLNGSIDLQYYPKDVTVIR